MPLDAIYLSHVAQELRNCLTGARVDKIHQPSRDTVVLALRGQSGTFRLLLCANSSHPRAHITAVSLENPASPPMFCMLLRKHLTGGRLQDILQPPMERVLDFTFQCPGLFYHLPPRQDKVSPFDITLADLSGMLEKISSPVRPDSFLLDHFAGLSPLICRELVSRYDPELEDLNALPLSGRYTFAAYLISYVFDCSRLWECLFFAPFDYYPCVTCFMYSSILLFRFLTKDRHLSIHAKYCSAVWG